MGTLTFSAYGKGTRHRGSDAAAKARLISLLGGEHLPPFFLIFSFFDLITSSIEFTTVTTKQSFETATKGEGKETGKPKGMGKLKAFITIIIYCFITPMRGGIGERGRDAYTRSTTPCLRTSGREHRCLSFLSIISFSL